jgi:FixJ family two-component response regulator
MLGKASALFPLFLLKVVDDEADLLAKTRMMLEKEGHKVHGFTNPVTGLNHVENGCKDCSIVISDIRMPAMSGFDLARRLKELRRCLL